MSAKAISSVSGTAIAVRGNDIDTDRIIPARYMKVVTFDGLGEYAFRDVRFLEDGTKTDHPFNNPAYRGASILLVNKNFGCGSSREHAPQALMRWGIAGIVGESFAEIFAGNCNALGIPAVRIDEDTIDQLMKTAESDPELNVTIDLDREKVIAGGREYAAQLPPAFRQALLTGAWDSTAELLQNRDAIDRVAATLPYTTNFA
jgi:3-isopropylmalate/(R)-2-methylmalate dehydratase small subunit